MCVFVCCVSEERCGVAWRAPQCRIANNRATLTCPKVARHKGLEAPAAQRVAEEDDDRCRRLPQPPQTEQVNQLDKRRLRPDQHAHDPPLNDAAREPAWPVDTPGLMQGKTRFGPSFLVHDISRAVSTFGNVLPYVFRTDQGKQLYGNRMLRFGTARNISGTKYEGPNHDFHQLHYNI